MIHLRRVQVLILAAVLLVAGSCSTQKNTSLSRTYHNITSKYNILFNGNESFKKGVKRVQDAWEDDYSLLLPVFTWSNKNTAKSTASDFNNAITKSTKLITLHSITAKPEGNPRTMSPKEREFYNKNEFNKWVDNAYLIIGKSHFYKHDHDLAIETFQFMLTQFPKEESRYMASIWMARAYDEKKDHREADKILTMLEADRKFPRKYMLDLLVTRANNQIMLGQKNSAIRYLERALQHKPKKPERVRFTFILGQLYQETGDHAKASEYFNRVIKMNPPYEKNFNARINRASLFSSGDANAREIKAQLNKMLKDEKNKEFRDQIYYALGNIAFRDGNVDEAIQFYSLSASSSVSNDIQKARSYLVLADIHYDRKKYVPSQAYYDSTINLVNNDFPGYQLIQSRATSLTRLVENLQTVSMQDSLHRVMALSPEERLRLIDRIIEDIRRVEQEQRMAEYNQQLDAAFATSRGSAITGQQDGKWYFYNPVSMSQGTAEFQAKWGRRRLEDNWRRSNKGIVMETADNDGKEQANGEQAQVVNNKSREFYLRNLPVNDSLMTVSHQKIRDGLYNAGFIYRNELNDYPEAIKVLEDLIRRYPSSEEVLPSMYQLYAIHTTTGNTARANYYKDEITRRYPGSQFARILTDPKFFEEQERLENKVNHLYEGLYQKYQSGSYAEVIRGSNKAIEEHPGHSLVPNFRLLKVMSIGKSGDMVLFREELDKFSNDYKNTDAAQLTRDIISRMEQELPSTEMTYQAEIAKEIYSANPVVPHFFVLALGDREDINRLVFDFINFNLDHFSNANYEVSSESLSPGNQLIVVRRFANATEALRYHDVFAGNTAVKSNIQNKNFRFFVISDSNFPIFMNDKSVLKYLGYFKSQYNR